MGSEWRERYLYPILGIATVSIILYLNFSDQLQFPVIVLWQNPMDFVSTDNSTHFVIKNNYDGSRPGAEAGANGATLPFYVNGWNSYWLLEESIWTGSRSKVSRMLRTGAQMGLTVCRTWAFSDGPGPNSIQISPGVFNEKVLKGLDFVIVEARKNKVRLIFSLVNNLPAFGGKAQYLKWAQEVGANVSSADSFFSNPLVKDYYKTYIKAIVTRKNSISGVRYNVEPAIFAWELINEPRCESSSSAPLLQTWIVEMAAYIKSLDQKHMVTVGTEGFYGPNSTTKSGANPGQWSSLLGTDFIQNSAPANIDFASVHAYPDSWIPNADLEAKLEFITLWVDSHILDGENILKKPVLFTEAGFLKELKSSTNRQGSHARETFLRSVYDKIYSSAQKGLAGSGALIWQLLVEEMEEYSDRFSLVAWEQPSTYKLIVQQSCRLRSLFFEKGRTKVGIDSKGPCFGV